MSRKKILFAGAEVMPYAATGGLGDVLGSLPAALSRAYGDEVDVRVVMPLYASIPAEWREQMKDEAIFTLSLAWRRQYCGVKSLCRDGVTYYFIDNEYYFGRPALYGYYDDGERFAYFSKAVIDMMSELNYYPDILHANDWQTALAVVYLEKFYRSVPGYGAIKTVFTIHNIEYQGKFGFEMIDDVFGLPEDSRTLFEYNGGVNLMKAAIECARRVSTVSPRYAEEILEPPLSHGLYHVLRAHRSKLVGILNGIDYDSYNPETDSALAAHYTANTATKGKALDKTALQKEIGLPERPVPLLAMISRLAAHKGLDLVREIGGRLLSEHDVQLVVLGTGNAEYEEYFRSLERDFPDRCRALIRYDRALSRRIYAAADLFLMPSQSEPCGLSQMIASRYGAIPVTRETGGLYDSIQGYWEKDGVLLGNGFTFAGYRSDELYERIGAALQLCADAKKKRAFVKKIMQVDFSWRTSAEKYKQMYDSLT